MYTATDPTRPADSTTPHTTALIPSPPPKRFADKSERFE